MDTISYLLGKKASGGGGGADISEYLDNVIEPIPDAYSEAIYGKVQPLLKKLPDNLTLGEGIDDLYSAFENLSGLVSIPLFDTSNVVNMGQMFIYCSSLVDIPQFNTSNVFSLSNAFVGCVSLSNESLNNILAMCINATNSYDGEKNLESIGLSAEQITICHGLSNYQAFLNAGWRDNY